MEIFTDFNQDLQQKRVKELLERVRASARHLPSSSFMYGSVYNTYSKTSSTTNEFTSVKGIQEKIIEYKLKISKLNDDVPKELYHFDPEEIVND